MQTREALKLNANSALGLRPLVRNLLKQVRGRHKLSSIQANRAGAVMEHLVGAKFDCLLGVGNVVHRRFLSPSRRRGRRCDFLIAQTAVHVTATPNEALIAKCRENIDSGLRPIVVTTQRGCDTVEQLAENVDMVNRIDVFEIEQFIALNIYELGKFVAAGNRTAVDDIITRYNAIVREFETDPSLCIDK